MDVHDFQMEWLDKWKEEIRWLISRSPFENSLTNAAQKEMERKSLKAVILRSAEKKGQQNPISLALYVESLDKICIVILLTDKEYRRQGAISRLIEVLKEKKKDLYLETTRFGLPHAIFERMGFIPLKESFREFVNEETVIVIPVGKKDDPICLKYPTEKEEEHDYLSLSIGCYERERREKIYAQTLLERLNNSQHSLSRFVRDKKNLERSLLDSPGTLEDLKKILGSPIGDHDQLCFLQLTGTSFLAWMGFQLTKIFVGHAGRKTRSNAKSKLYRGHQILAGLTSRTGPNSPHFPTLQKP